MSFVFSNVVIRNLKSESVDIEKVRNAIDSAIAETTAGAGAERTETVKAAKGNRVQITLKDVTKAKGSLSKPLAFAHVSQRLGELEKLNLGLETVTLPKGLVEWLGKFTKEEKKAETVTA